jgi:diguanylate cyclase (GGDEF)-like protein
MELKTYLQILLKKWWLVLPIFLITLTAGIFLTYTTTPLYSSTATYIVVPGSSPDDIKIYTDALGTLSRSQEIATTFTEIAASRAVKTLAVEQLSIEGGGDYSVSTKLLPGTNIVEFNVVGPDPVIVKDLVNAIGTVTESYVQGLYEVFILLPLDEATIPNQSFTPNVSLNIVLAAIFGLVLGGGLAFMSQYLETPVDWVANLNIIDHRTGAYNKEYFMRRLSSEILRSKRNRYPLSIALMRINDLDLIKGNNASKIRAEVLYQVALLTNQHLREEDLLASFNDDIFAFLLPDMTGENAKAIMEYLQTRISWAPFQSTIGDVKLTVKGIFGVVSYTHNGTNRDDLVDQASKALKLAEVNESGTVYLVDAELLKTDGGK